MCLVVVFGYRMSAKDNFDSIFFFYEFLKVPDIWTRRVPHDHPGGQVDILRPVFLHFGRDVFHIPSRASAACRIPYHFYVFSFMGFESAFIVPSRSKAFASAAIPVTVADYDPDSDFFHGLHLSNFDDRTLL